MNSHSGQSSVIAVLSDHPTTYRLALHLPRNDVNSAAGLCIHSLGNQMSWEITGITVL